MTAIPQDAIPTTCPHCGSTELIRTVPEKDPFNIMIVCNTCHMVVSGSAATLPAPGQPPVGVVHAIAEKALQLCLNSGKLQGIRYYYVTYNELPGVTPIDLMQAKNEVEALLQARGLTNAVKKPNRNGCVITLIILLLIIASIIYFFTNR
ncbi:MAG TPA: hypothetical protein VM802_13140 [Chitinophaga sp.]|uniref:hypothetical protein n=1 Tax=Chitinophaga sp. TaxID=1869181 RepID=UPI002BE05A86|nr:hypothetical protein [Chitinophaga sp.]HVI45813.1 hypothetical protein [Chitinophaga sp.]